MAGTLENRLEDTVPETKRRKSFKRRKRSAWPKAAGRSSKMKTKTLSNRKVDAEFHPSTFSGEVEESKL